jgi:hypothetical protein
VPSVTIDRIAAVHADVVEAVVRTTSSSPLPASEQDELLARSCAEACDLLQDWLADHWWEQTRPAHDRPVKDYVPTQKEFAKFLGPMLKDSLVRARQSGITIDDSLVDQAREKVAATARRFPRMGCDQLFDEARTRVTALQHEVCGVAAQFRPSAEPAAPAEAGRLGTWRRRAQAEAEIGRLVDLLDHDVRPADADGMRLIGELVARAGATGLVVSCQFTGSADGLPARASDAAYRVVQESLTNAFKHAPGAPVDIVIDGTSGHVEIGVLNGPAAGPPSGLERAGGGRGLTGMRERVAACGGEISAGPADGGGWRVLARLPHQPGQTQIS